MTDREWEWRWLFLIHTKFNPKYQIIDYMIIYNNKYYYLVHKRIYFILINFEYKFHFIVNIQYY